MNNLKVLTEMGLSAAEAESYVYLLKNGGASATEIAQGTGLKRTNIYPLMKNLANKGFVTIFFRKKQFHFYAQPPQRIERYFERKLLSFQEILPQLISFDKKHAQQFGLRFIQTREELKEFYLEVLDEYKGRSYDYIGNTHSWGKIDPEFFSEYRFKRAKAKIKTRLLLTENSRSVNPKDKSLLRDWRYLPPEYNFISNLDIYDNQVLIQTPESNALAVVIAVPVMVDVFKATFEIMWKYVGRK